MDERKYSVRLEEGLWHWRVFALRGAQIGHGAATDSVRSRAEALVFAADPARIQDIESLERAHFDLAYTRANLAFEDARNRFTVATERIDELRARDALSKAIVERSNEAVAQARQFLDADGF